MVITTYKAYSCNLLQIVSSLYPPPFLKNNSYINSVWKYLSFHVKTSKCVHKSIKKWKLVMEISRI